MRRLAFITLLVSGAAVAWPPPVSGQQAPMPVVGVLSSQSQDSEAAVLAAWHQALNETGYVGGRNVALEYRFADGHAERLPMLATDLVRRQVTVLMANTTPPAFAAQSSDRDDPHRICDRSRPCRGGPGRKLQSTGRKRHRRDLPVQQAGGEAAGASRRARIGGRSDRHVGAYAQSQYRLRRQSAV